MQGFILTRHWRNTRPGMQLEFWLAAKDGPVQLLINGQQPVFFVRQSDIPAVKAKLATMDGWWVKKLAMKNHRNEPVAGVYFKNQRNAHDARGLLTPRISVWEGDIRPPERFLMERFITGPVAVTGQLVQKNDYLSVANPTLRPVRFTPAFKTLSIDIETSMDMQTLYSIGVYSQSVQKVFMVGERQKSVSDDKVGADQTIEIETCAGQRQCLQRFLQFIHDNDPDIIIGWNVVGFDFWVLTGFYRQQNIPFAIGRGRQLPHWREDPSSERRYLEIPGRVVLDGIDLLKTAFYQFDSYALENVARQMLGEGKLLSGSQRGDEISELFHNDKQTLARYNLKDCELVWDIFKKAGLIEFAIERARLTGMPLDRIGGSVASFDFAYLPRLHRKGYVAPNTSELQSDIVSPGGYVLDSRPGIYKNVLVLDFKSLYPSIIRTFHIDPYAYWYARHNDLRDDEVVPGFNGAFFARSESLLPEIIENLWQERDKAKHDKNQPLSYAIKIIMNSFYGVLGSPGCRFFDPRICSSITLRGHEIITRSREWIERQGYQVIYGDTDSLFVWVGDERGDAKSREIGAELASGLNGWWKQVLQNELAIDSALEIEFETHYSHFLMPTIRGSEQGSKKRYAGLIRNDSAEKLVFKGLETVRTDWTQLAKNFQQELYLRVFKNQPYEHYIQQLVADVLAGLHDEALVYRKRLRRKLGDYQKNVPPHVRAARKLQQAAGEQPQRGAWVNYRITVNGPEPMECQNSAIDYSHYIDRQLQPVADSVLYFLGTSFARIVDRQLGLFE